MEVKEFKSQLEADILYNSPKFVQNMLNNSEESHTFIEWLNMFIKWMEWSSEEDYNRFK